MKVSVLFFSLFLTNWYEDSIWHAIYLDGIMLQLKTLKSNLLADQTRNKTHLFSVGMHLICKSVSLRNLPSCCNSLFGSAFLAVFSHWKSYFMLHFKPSKLIKQLLKTFYFNIGITILFLLQLYKSTFCLATCRKLHLELCRMFALNLEDM